MALKQDITKLKFDIKYNRIKIEHDLEFIKSFDELKTYLTKINNKAEKLYCLEVININYKQDLFDYYKDIILSKDIKEINKIRLMYLHLCIMLNRYKEAQLILNHIRPINNSFYVDYLLVDSKYEYIFQYIYILSCVENNIYLKNIFRVLNNVTTYDEELAKLTISNFIRNDSLNNSLSYFRIITLNNGGYSKERFEVLFQMSIDEFLDIYLKHYYSFECVRQLFFILNLKSTLTYYDFYKKIDYYMDIVSKYKDGFFNKTIELFNVKEAILLQLLINEPHYYDVLRDEIIFIFNNELFNKNISKRLLVNVMDALIKSHKIIDFIDITQKNNFFYYNNNRLFDISNNNKDNIYKMDVINNLLNYNEADIVKIYLNTYISQRYSLEQFLVDISYYKNIDLIISEFEKIKYFGYIVNSSTINNKLFFYNIYLKNDVSINDNELINYINFNRNKQISVSFNIINTRLVDDKVHFDLTNISCIKRIKKNDYYICKEYDEYYDYYDKAINNIDILNDNRLLLPNMYDVTCNINKFYDKHMYLISNINMGNVNSIINFMKLDKQSIFSDNPELCILNYETINSLIYRVDNPTELFDNIIKCCATSEEVFEIYSRSILKYIIPIEDVYKRFNVNTIKNNNQFVLEVNNNYYKILSFKTEIDIKLKKEVGDGYYLFSFHTLKDEFNIYPYGNIKINNQKNKDYYDYYNIISDTLKYFNDLDENILVDKNNDIKKLINKRDYSVFINKYLYTVIDCFINANYNDILVYVKKYKNNLFVTAFDKEIHYYLYDNLNALKDKINSFIEKLFNTDISISGATKIYYNSFLKYYYSVIEFLNDFVYYKKIREELLNLDIQAVVLVLDKLKTNTYNVLFSTGYKALINVDNDNIEMLSVLRLNIKKYDRYSDVIDVKDFRLVVGKFDKKQTDVDREYNDFLKSLYKHHGKIFKFKNYKLVNPNIFYILYINIIKNYIDNEDITSFIKFLSMFTNSNPYGNKSELLHYHAVMLSEYFRNNVDNFLKLFNLNDFNDICNCLFIISNTYFKKYIPYYSIFNKKRHNFIKRMNIHLTDAHICFNTVISRFDYKYTFSNIDFKNLDINYLYDIRLNSLNNNIFKGEIINKNKIVSHNRLFDSIKALRKIYFSGIINYEDDYDVNLDLYNNSYYKMYVFEYKIRYLMIIEKYLDNVNFIIKFLNNSKCLSLKVVKSIYNFDKIIYKFEKLFNTKISLLNILIIYYNTLINELISLDSLDTLIKNKFKSELNEKSLYFIYKNNGFSLTLLSIYGNFFVKIKCNNYSGTNGDYIEIAYNDLKIEDNKFVIDSDMINSVSFDDVYKRVIVDKFN